jgi:hypothetical protein
MKNTAVIFCLLLLVAGFCLAQAGKGMAQGSAGFNRGLLDSLFGTADNRPSARIVFTHTQDQLCVALGTIRGPDRIANSAFGFHRVLAATIDDAEFEKMKVKFPGKPASKDPEVQVYETCLESEARHDDLQFDQIEVSVRLPRLSPYTFYVNYPPEGVAWGLDIQRTTTGGLEAYDYVAPEQEGESESKEPEEE